MTCYVGFFMILFAVGAVGVAFCVFWLSFHCAAVFGLVLCWLGLFRFVGLGVCACHLIGLLCVLWLGGLFATLGRCVTLFCCVEFTIGFLLGLLAVDSVVVVWFGCFVDCG